MQCIQTVIKKTQQHTTRSSFSGESCAFNNQINIYIFCCDDVSIVRISEEKKYSVHIEEKFFTKRREKDKQIINVLQLLMLIYLPWGIFFYLTLLLWISKRESINELCYAYLTTVDNH